MVTKNGNKWNVREITVAASRQSGKLSTTIFAHERMEKKKKTASQGTPATGHNGINSS